MTSAEPRKPRDRQKICGAGSRWTCESPFARHDSFRDHSSAANAPPAATALLNPKGDGSVRRDKEDEKKEDEVRKEHAEQKQKTVDPCHIHMH